MKISQYEICIVDLNPTKGSEMTKIRPCIVLSPDEANKYLNTIIIAPVTSKVHNFKFRVPVNISSVFGEIALDHIRSIDKSRVVKVVAKLDPPTIIVLKSTLKEFLVD
jgi:mRNA interferase MazF